MTVNKNIFKQFVIFGGHSRLARNFLKTYEDVGIPISRSDCDITSPLQIKLILNKYRPRYVINCAAMTDIDLCEKFPQRCIKINSNAILVLSQICLKKGVKLIHISSDYAVNPINSYGFSKQLSEKYIDPKHLVIRTNFYDMKTYILKNLSADQQVDAYADVYFNPISITRVCKEIFNNRNKTGLMNIFTKKRITNFEFAQLAQKLLRKRGSLIHKANFVNRFAPRPKDSFVKPDINVTIKTDLAEYLSGLVKSED